jgi:hypothetical protein
LFLFFVVLATGVGEVGVVVVDTIFWGLLRVGETKVNPGPICFSKSLPYTSRNICMGSLERTLVGSYEKVKVPDSGTEVVCLYRTRVVFGFGELDVVVVVDRVVVDILGGTCVLVYVV